MGSSGSAARSARWSIRPNPSGSAGTWRDLVAAFKATLEELEDSNLLLHVVDASSPAAGAQIEAVNKTLDDLGVLEQPTLVLLNKCDQADEDALKRLQLETGGVILSARTKAGLTSFSAQSRKSSLSPSLELGVRSHSTTKLRRGP